MMKGYDDEPQSVSQSGAIGKKRGSRSSLNH